MRLRIVFGWPCVVAGVCVLVMATFARADLVHRYSFTADASDSVGGAHGTAYGNVTYADGQATLNNNGSQNSNANGVSPPAAPPGAYIDLPNGMISALGLSATFEGWVTWNGPGDSSWQRIFDFGTSNSGENSSGGAANSSYVMMTARTSWGVYGSGYRYGPNAEERSVYNPTALATGVQQHVVLAWDGVNSQATLYLNGDAVAFNTAHFNLTNLSDVNNWLGRAQWPDAMYSGRYNEFRVYNEVLPIEQIRKNGADGPDAEFTRFTPPTAAQLRAAPKHRYSFSGDANDSIGTAHGTLVNNTMIAYYDNGVLKLGNDGAQFSNGATGAGCDGDYVNLPNGIISALGESASFEAWYTWNDAYDGRWQRIFDFGTSDGGEDVSPGAGNSTYIMAAPRDGSDVGRLRFGYRYGTNADERIIDAKQSLEPGVETHVVITWDGAADKTSMYVDGKLVTSRPTHFELSSLNDVNNWLGRSQWNDMMSIAWYNEFRIYNYALSAEEVLGNYAAGADTLNVSPVQDHPGDANRDGKVDDLDASILAANWQRTGGATWTQADFNGDGDVNDLDASILAANWQFGVGGAVPEPSTIVLALAAAVALLALPRRR